MTKRQSSNRTNEPYQPKDKKKKVQDPVGDVNILAHMLDYFKKKLTTFKGDDKIEESLGQDLALIPDIPGCTDMTSLKRLLFSLKIEYSQEQCPLFNSYDNVTILEKYAHDASETNLIEVLEEYDLENDQYRSILKALIPPKLNIYQTQTQLQYTTTHFCPLFELALVSKEKLYVNSNKQIPELLNTKILPPTIAKELSEFQVDSVLILNSNNEYFPKIIREDKHDFFLSHFDHPDLLRLIFAMRLAISYNVMHYVKEKFDPNIHNNMYVLGMTTDNTQTNLYCIMGTVDWKCLTVSYKLYTVGSFRHENIHERAQLIHIIVKSFSLPSTEHLESYLSSKHSRKAISTETKTHGFEEVSSNLVLQLNERISSDLLCNATESLWKGTLTRLEKTWKVVFKQYEKETNDILISNLNFLSLYLTCHKSCSMILLEGQDIGSIFDRSEIERFICDIIMQLGMLQREKIIHNDLKPSNIVKYDGHYFIIDYGLSVKYSSVDNDVCKDLNNQIITSTAGTDDYLPPEKKEHGSISPKSDIYSIGCTFKKIISANGSEDNEFNSMLKTLISNMKQKSVKERWTVKQCFEYLKTYSKYELGNSWDFFKDKKKYTNEILEEDYTCFRKLMFDE